MRTSLATIAPQTFPAQAGYFSRPIPRTLHEVVATAAQAATRAAESPWLGYAAQHGYEHRVWSAAAAATELCELNGRATEAVGSPRTAALVEAAQLLEGYRQLAVSGGILVGPRACPPEQGGISIDLSARLPMRGAVLATALHARHVGGASVYLTPQFIAASPGHPLVAHWAATAAENVAHRLAHDDGPVAARYLTGSAFISRTLSGTFRVIPYPYLQRLGIFP